jgi:hypothetical protein
MCSKEDRVILSIEALIDELEHISEVTSDSDECPIDELECQAGTIQSIIDTYNEAP